LKLPFEDSVLTPSQIDETNKASLNSWTTTNEKITPSQNDEINQPQLIIEQNIE
jgi:hypothetical protein